MGIDVIGIGSLNFDYIYEVDTLASGDQQVVIKSAHGAPGGSSANTIYGLSKLGVQTGFFGVLGDDPEGSEILKQLANVGTDTSKIKIMSSEPTSKVLVFVDNNGERAMYSIPGASTTFHSVVQDFNWFKDANYTIISAIPGDTQLKHLEELVSQIYENTRIVFMPGALYIKFGYSMLEEIIKRSYLVLLNRREIEELTNQQYEDGVRKLLEGGCQIIVVTLGEDGCLVAQDENIFKVPSPKIQKDKLVDTTGAGDAFAAGLIYGLLVERGIQNAVLLGNLMARACIQSIGARAGLLDKNKLELEFGEYSKEVFNE